MNLEGQVATAATWVSMIPAKRPLAVDNARRRARCPAYGGRHGRRADARPVCRGQGPSWCSPVCACCRLAMERCRTPSAGWCGAAPSGMSFAWPARPGQPGRVRRERFGASFFGLPRGRKQASRAASRNGRAGWRGANGQVQRLAANTSLAAESRRPWQRGDQPARGKALARCRCFVELGAWRRRRVLANAARMSAGSAPCNGSASRPLAG